MHSCAALARFRYVPSAGSETAIRVRGHITYIQDPNSTDDKAVWWLHEPETKTFHAGDLNNLLIAYTYPMEDNPDILCRHTYTKDFDPDGNVRSYTPSIKELGGTHFLVELQLVLSRGDAVLGMPRFSFDLNISDAGMPTISRIPSSN